MQSISFNKNLGCCLVRKNRLTSMISLIFDEKSCLFLLDLFLNTIKALDELWSTYMNKKLCGSQRNNQNIADFIAVQFLMWTIE